jgi:asparagine synthase (glutamine-hydrolysing)
MCGICGMYAYSNGMPADPAVLEQMLDTIVHRGPDDFGTHVDRNLALGSRRLSIIDLPGGRQPITNEDGTISVVFNGEIYNYRELAGRLRRRGHVLATASDTETIVHLYEELGDNLVDELRGMFTFALWDARRRRLVLARDRLGIKPLYYAISNGQLIFGSEIKAILKHPEIHSAIDLQALSDFVSLRYVPAPKTMFEGIRALPPGHIMTCDGNGTALRPYWNLSFARDGSARVTEEEYADRLAELLRESVRLHLISDVPFGAFLSGGVDSSTIVALMTEILEQPVKTFSVGFEGSGAAFSELPYARLVAQRYETDHHEVLFEPDQLPRLASKVVWHLDQPIGDEATLPNYIVSELASRHVKMVLTGEGGDELFAGYARYSGERLSPLVRSLPTSVKSLVLRGISRLPQLRRQKLALYALCQPDEASRLASWFALFNEEMKGALLSTSFKQAIEAPTAQGVFAPHLAQTDATDALSRMLYVDTKLWLPDDLLARGDKTSMAASLEARVPLLDHKLVEFAASLPPDLKLRRLTRKYLLKKVSAPLLPPEIVQRSKKGFPTPLSVWFRHELNGFVRDTLSPATIQRRGLFDSRYIERLLAEHTAGRADHGSLIWSLVSVELWYQLFIDAPSSVSSSQMLAARSAE